MTETITKKKLEEKYKHLNKVKQKIMHCISCGDCREATDYTADPPKWGVCVAREHTTGFEPFFGRGKMQIIRSVWQGKLQLSKDLAEVIYQCPTCNACAEACAYDFDNATVYEAFRAELIDAGHGLESHAVMNRAIIELLNPYQRDNLQKGNWISKLDFNVKYAPAEKAEILYFVGCTAGLLPEIENVALITAKILNKLGADFSVLGENEVCCGSVALRTGDLEAYNFALERNIELFLNSGAKFIITSCAGCYRTLKIDYGERLGDLGIKVLHSIQLIQQLLDQKAVKLKNLGIKVTYHDPCHTGRNSGAEPLYNEPRELLRKIAELNEMKTIKGNAKCCGAGGGLKKAFSNLALEIAKSRIHEAEETGADYLVTICPFCNKNLSDAIKAVNSRLKMIDLLELIEMALV